jgi:replication-associated recombination protein RarA
LLGAVEDGTIILIGATTENPSFYTQDEIINILKKRPLTEDDIKLLFNKESRKLVKNMLADNRLKMIRSFKQNFFIVNNFLFS